MKNLFRFCILSMLISLSARLSIAQSTLMHYWNFNTLAVAYNNPNIPPITADFSVMDTSNVKMLYVREPGTSGTYAGYLDNVAGGDSLNVRMNAGAGQALRVRNPSDSMELRFEIPTTGYKNIVMKYVLESSSTTSGMLTELFDYSTDGGVTWKNKSAGLTVNGANSDTLDVTQAQYQGSNWGLVTITFGTDLTVNNNSKLIFRIKFSGNTSLTKGNNRLDDVTIDGTSITADVPEEIPATPAVTLYPNPVRGAATSTIFVNSPAGGKTIQVVNALGEIVAVTSGAAAQLPVSVAQLPRGLYFVNIFGMNGVKIGGSKFVKF